MRFLIPVRFAVASIPLGLIPRSLLRFNPEQNLKYPGRLRRGFLFMVFGTVAGIGGCSSMDVADYQQQADKAMMHQLHGWSYTQSDTEQLSQLTDLIPIEPLKQMVATAMEKNPGLQQTALALKIAYAQRDATAGNRGPRISAGFTGSDRKNAETSYQADLSISWELDLWQKLSDNIKASEMDIASSAATFQGAKDALAANIMRTWLQISYQKQLIAIESKRLKVQEDNEAFIRQRYRNGLGQLESLDTARTSTATTRSTLAFYQEQLSQYERTLWLLLGQTGPDPDLEISSGFPQVLEPLAGLPEQDLGRRPDLQAAYYNILAEQYQTRVAYKALLPSISLSVSLSDLGSSPRNALFTSPAWNLLGQLTAPLFHGGTLRAQAEIAELSAEQSYQAFQDTLLSAVNEVENALGQEQTLERQQQYLNDALASARRSFVNYQTRYQQGLVDILDLLTVQQQTFDLQSQLAQVTLNRLTNRIDLGLALGLGISS